MARIYTHTQTYIDDLPVSERPDDVLDPIIRYSQDGTKAVIGYLVHDEEGINPFEDFDGEGYLYHAPNARWRDFGPSNYRTELGLTSDGEIDWTAAKEAMYDFYVAQIDAMESARFDQFKHDGLTEQDVKNILKYELQEILLNSYAYDIDDAGHSTIIERLSDCLEGGDDYTVDSDKAFNFCNSLSEGKTIEQFHEECIEAGLVGNKDAVLLDMYEHGGVVYSLHGTGMQCRWDTSRAVAVWVPCKCALENIEHTLNSPDNTLTRREIVEKYARGVLEQYNACLLGDVWVMCVNTFTREQGGPWHHHDSEAVGGFIGSEYAEQEVLQAVEWETKKWSNENES